MANSEQDEAQKISLSDNGTLQVSLDRSILASYEILSELGKGGFGIVRFFY